MDEGCFSSWVHPKPSSPLSRRQFSIHTSAILTALAIPTQRSEADPADSKSLRAAIIGHTGRGNYGHGLDEVFSNRSNIQVVAVADADETGRSKALKKTGAERGYADYRKMLETEKPALVAVAPRHSNEHFEMVRAAVNVGAHVYCEKPFTTSLTEADELLSLAARLDRKVAVAHQMRLAPQVRHLKKWIQAGGIGEIVRLQSHGKQDQRAGGEDMIVLGTHIFDMMRFFCGDAVRCSADISFRGRKADRNMAGPASEGIGPVLGDEIDASFEFENGVKGSFTSSARLRETLGPWGIEILGSKGAAWIQMDIFPRVLVRQEFKTTQSERRETWGQLPDDPSMTTPISEQGFATANKRVVDDWLDSIAGKREPECSGSAATRAIEMAMAVYDAAISASSVTIPLKHREHPLINRG